jgi:beta-1,4-mannosyltransferase
VTAQEKKLRVLTPLNARHEHPNPYITQLYRHLAPLGVDARPAGLAGLVTGSADVWHQHWPDAAIRHPNLLRALWRTGRQFFLMLVARLRGVAVIWTVHNLRGHESHHGGMESWFMRWFVRNIDAAIHLSRTGRALAEAEWPALTRVPSSVVVHGHYRDVFPAPSSRAVARKQLGVADNAVVAAFAGLIRPYKNVPRLITEFARMADPAAVLLVAGAPNDAAESARVTASANGSPAVRLQLEHLNDDALQRVVRAADLVVLPFRETLNSGSAILALSLGRPVLVPRAGALVELEGAVGKAWVRLYDGDLTSETLTSALAWARETKRGEIDLSALEWGPIASETMNAYRTALSRGR